LAVTGSGLTGGAVPRVGAVAIIAGGTLTLFGATGFPLANAAPPTAVIAPGTVLFTYVIAVGRRVRSTGLTA